MTQEEKQFLLVDLCARLPYGVIVDYKENEFEFPHWKITTVYPETLDGWIGYDKRVGAGSESGSRPFKIGEVKPYLRLMSSMTEEEKKEFLFATDGELRYSEVFDVIKPIHGSEDYCASFVSYLKAIDWLNTHHFDYRGLIEKGFAIEAPEGMYNTKIK